MPIDPSTRNCKLYQSVRGNLRHILGLDAPLHSNKVFQHAYDRCYCEPCSKARGDKPTMELGSHVTATPKG